MGAGGEGEGARSRVQAEEIADKSRASLHLLARAVRAWGEAVAGACACGALGWGGRRRGASSQPLGRSCPCSQPPLRLVISAYGTSLGLR